MDRRARRSRGPTVRGVVCVLVYAAAFVTVAVVGFASVPRRIQWSIQRALLRPASWTGDRVDWAAHDWVDGVRRRLGTSPYFRAFSEILLDDALMPADEALGYACTVDPPDGESAAWLERRLADAGFHRNPTAYLEFRERRDRQFERSSWALRKSVTADHQLHVRLFESRDGTVDVYGHWEAAVTAGAGHYEPPDYRTGVVMTLAALERAGIPAERRSEIGGVAPVDVTAVAAPAPPVDVVADRERSVPAGGE